MQENSLSSNQSLIVRVTIAVLTGQALVHIGMAIISYIIAQQYLSSNPTPWGRFLAGSNTVATVIFLALALPSLWLAFELWNKRLHTWFRTLWATIFLFAGILYIPTLFGPYLVYALFGLVFLVTAITLFISLYKTSRDGWLTAKPSPEPSS